MSETVETTAAEYSALTGSVAFVRRPAPGVLELRGDDAAEFLQGQVTNDVEAAGPGEGRYAALLTPKGKIRSDMRILNTGDGLLVITEAAYLPLVRHTVDTYRIGFRFTFEDHGDAKALVSLIGPDFRAALDRLAPGAGEALAEAENANTSLTIAECAVLAIATVLGVDLLVGSSEAEAVASALRDAGVAEASEGAAETVRIEYGIPRIGRELTDETIPEEAALNERAVNFEKGCYVGQETVARLHYKGKPNRHLRGLRADAPLTAGSTVTAADGRELGVIGSAALSPANGPVALAILRREAEPGDKVDAGGVPARVVQANT